jgi:hypothetical protein
MISQSAFAKQVGVSKQAVSKAVKAGRIPVYDATGASVSAAFGGLKFVKPEEAATAFRLSRARIDDAVVAELSAELDRELSIEPEDADPAPASAAAAKLPTLVGAKTAKEELQADLLRLRLARERGELVPRQAQLDAFETAGRAVGRQFQTMTAWAEEINGVARSGGMPGLTAWLRAKANELCAQLADTLTASAAQEPDDDSGPADPE